MYLESILNLKLAIKMAKPDCIKVVHQFIFDSNKNRQDRENLRKFEGFKFKIDDEEFEIKLTDVLEKFNKVELI